MWSTFLKKCIILYFYEDMLLDINHVKGKYKANKMSFGKGYEETNHRDRLLDFVLSFACHLTSE